MFESVWMECEKLFGCYEEIDKVFEEIFWCVGMWKVGKKNVVLVFRIQFREWCKIIRGMVIEFVMMLVEDIVCRNGKQFGFDRLLLLSYLNGQCWNDEKLEII